MSRFFGATDGGFGTIFDDYSNDFYSNPIDWNNIINQGFAVGSQVIGAFGKNPTTQVAYNPAQNSIFAVQSGQPSGSYGATPYSNLTPQQQSQMLQQAGVGGTVGSGVDGIFNWMMANPLPVFLGIAGVYLLMREPPRSRR